MGFLDKLLGRSAEPEETELAFPDIPEWIGEKEHAIHEEADSAVRESRPRVQEALQDMSETVAALKSAKPDENEVLHPKLLRVVEQGVPRYAAAMEKTLSLPLSEIPGEYYDNCVELISQIAKNTKGPGRYIANVFPAQMKEIRLQTDIIGREINAISSVLSKTREQSGWVDAANERHALILSKWNQLSGSEKEAVQLAEMNETLTAELSRLKQDLRKYSGGPEAEQYGMLMEQRRAYEAKIHDADADYGRILSRSANVFRKAIHICELSGDKETIALLKGVRKGLESSSSTERVRGLAAYPSLFPLLARMIRENEGLVKNKDEMSLFAEQDAFVIPLSDAIARMDELNAENVRITGALDKLSYAGKKEGMEENIRVVTERIAANSAQINDIQDVTEDIRASVPELVVTLRQNIEYLAGEGVHIALIQVPDFS